MYEKIKSLIIAVYAPSEGFYAVLVDTKTVAGKSGKSDPTLTKVL